MKSKSFCGRQRYKKILLSDFVFHTITFADTCFTLYPDYHEKISPFSFFFVFVHGCFHTNFKTCAAAGFVSQSLAGRTGKTE